MLPPPRLFFLPSIPLYSVRHISQFTLAPSKSKARPVSPQSKTSRTSFCPAENSALCCARPGTLPATLRML